MIRTREPWSGGRSTVLGMTYAGDLTPPEAWELLEREPGAVLVDVRSEAEWMFVGVPDLTGLGKKLVAVSWNHWPGGTRNARFLDELEEAGIPAADTVLFLCRSGVRSRAAAIAATQAGITTAYNVSEGFEGDLDEAGHRGGNGWRAHGLPWRQS
jgi:rhodanese-related sulfurtransferase